LKRMGIHKNDKSNTYIRINGKVKNKSKFIKNA